MTDNEGEKRGRFVQAIWRVVAYQSTFFAGCAFIAGITQRIPAEGFAGSALETACAVSVYLTFALFLFASFASGILTFVGEAGAFPPNFDRLFIAVWLSYLGGLFALTVAFVLFCWLRLPTLAAVLVTGLSVLLVGAMALFMANASESMANTRLS